MASNQEMFILTGTNYDAWIRSFFRPRRSRQIRGNRTRNTLRVMARAGATPAQIRQQEQRLWRMCADARREVDAWPAWKQAAAAASLTHFRGVS